MHAASRPARLLAAPLAILLLSFPGVASAGGPPAITEIQRIPNSEPMGTERGFGIRVAADDGRLAASSDAHWEQWDGGGTPYAFSSQTATPLVDVQMEDGTRVVVEPTVTTLSDTGTGAVGVLPIAASLGAVGWPYAAVALPTPEIRVYEDSVASWDLEDTFAIAAGATDLALDGDRLLVGFAAASEVHDYQRTGGSPPWDPFGGSVDPLEPPAMHPGGDFGASVATSGDWLAVGAPEQTVQAGRGLGLGSAGRVFLYEKDMTGAWVERQTLAGTESSERLGISVDLLGTRLLVGAPGATVDAVGGAGRVDVYEYDGASWQRVALLRAATPQDGGALGTSVELTPSGALAGAPGDDYDEMEDASKGAVYVWSLTEEGLLFEDGFESGDIGAWGS